MALTSELKAEVKAIFASAWSERDGQVVPESTDLKLGNDAVKLDATILYADMSGSTQLVDSRQPRFAAEIYKAFLHCAAKLITHHGGVITAYDGDRIMAVFIGESKNTNAAKAALRINWARLQVVQPALEAQYPDAGYTLNHVVGVDTSSVLVARTGIRGSNDLVWVGRAANYAAKLSAESHTWPSYVTGTVYDKMHKSAKTAPDGRHMWQEAQWTDMNNMRVYRSTWYWGL